MQSQESSSTTIYANDKQQLLNQHSFAVGILAKIIANKFFGETNQPLLQAIFIAGCLHDIGKLDVEFQRWLSKEIKKQTATSEEYEDGVHIDNKKFSFNNHPRHNEISVLLYSLLDNKNNQYINIDLKKLVKHVLYWHHSLAFRTENQEEFATYQGIATALEDSNKDNKLEISLDKARALIAEIAKLEKTYLVTDNSLIARIYTDTNTTVEQLTEKDLPAYKDYSTDEHQIANFNTKIQYNAKANIMRACVITADRLISSLSKVELNKHIVNKTLTDFATEQFNISGLNYASNLADDIATCLNNFANNERSQQQNEVANKLAENNEYIQVLAGAAGCGKTKIALEWAKNSNAKQLIWICPRVQICQGVFEQLTSKDYLKNTNASIEIYTGEFKYTNNYKTPTKDTNYFSANIVITTIDQILNYIISHTKIDRLLNYLSAHVVFDEYHEYICMPAFNLLFAELLASKEKSQRRANTLLVSATPHYSYLEEILEIYPDDVIRMPSFNKNNYQIEFEEYDETKLDDSNPLYKPQAKSTIVISNTATTAQLSFLKNQHDENAIVFHSKFTKLDKQQLFTKVFNCFRQNGNKEFDVLRSGPICQASLNITAGNITTESTTAENTLQRLGRQDRFGENVNGINKFTIAIPKTFIAAKNQGNVARFLAKNNCLKSAQAWYKFLYKTTNKGKKVLTLTEIYTLYKNFHTNCQDYINADLLAAMQQSAKVISDKLNAPIVVVRPKNKSKYIKIARQSLRGDNRFVQLAVCDLTNINEPDFQDEYAYKIPSDESIGINNITETKSKIEKLKLLEHMAKKHARINDNSEILGIPKTKITFREAVLANLARDPNYPIYLSYIPSDLDKLGGVNNQHENAIFYITTNLQAVGSLSLKEIKNAKNHWN